jgi:hypothetical protein
MIKRGFRYETPYESPLDHGGRGPTAADFMIVIGI